MIKWNKTAVQQLLDAIRFIEENAFYSYAEELEKEILIKIRDIPRNPTSHPLDKYKTENDGTYRAFEIDQYRISYKIQKNDIHVLRIRHTSRQVKRY